MSNKQDKKNLKNSNDTRISANVFANPKTSDGIIKTKSTMVGDYIIAFICFLVIIICLLPMLNLLARSVSDPLALIKNEVLLWPKGFNFDAYAGILKDSRYTWSLLWTAMLTVGCMLLSIFMTAICAYPLTYDHLKGRKAINTFIILTMYFNAGTIPMYLLFKELKLLDNPLVLAIPFCLSVFNMIIMRSAFYSIPLSLRESAELDGAGPIRIMWSIYLPLSMPTIATLLLFYAVGRWNGYSDAMMFMNKNRDFYPIQYLLYNMIQSKMSPEAQRAGDADLTLGVGEAMKAAMVMFATIPILVIYPFLQRYFIAGVTLGAVKE